MNTAKEVATEISRDHWLAASAATQIAKGTPIEQIATVTLEALADCIAFELLDRTTPEYIKNIPF